MDLSHKHPQYVWREAEWLEAWDFYRSGRYVLEPGRVLGENQFTMAPERDMLDSTTVSAERERGHSRFVALSLQSYLHSHPRESLEGYNDRNARAKHYPVLRNVVDIYRAATLRTPPTRQRDDETIDPIWPVYWEDADLHGTSIDALVGDALAEALVFHLMFAVTDKPAFASQVANREQQLARGERAYTTLVRPLDVLDWRINPVSGRFDWITIREDAPDIRSPGSETAKVPYWVRVWTANDWSLWSPQQEQTSAAPVVDQGVTWKWEAGGPHPCGEPPVAVLFAGGSTSRRSLDADGMLAGLTRVDRSIFNLRSLIDEVIYGQAFASLWVPDDGGKAPGAIDLGIGIANSYNSENGTPLYLAPPAQLLLALWQILREEMNLARETYGVGRGKAEYSKEERSAEALTVESRNEQNRAAVLAERCEDFDRQIHRHVAAWEGKGVAPIPEYSRDVSLRSLGAQLTDALSLQALKAVPHGAMREVAKPLVAEHMKQSGRNKEAIDRAVHEVEIAEEPQPPKPPAFGGDEEETDAGA
jgi:hypothetical protein